MNKKYAPLLWVIATLTVLVGGYLAISIKPSSDNLTATSTPEQATGTTTNATTEKNISSIAVGIPSCIISAQPGPSSWVLDQKNRVALTWTSENGTEAYLWLVVPMGGSIVDAAIRMGDRVALNGSQTIEIQPASSYPDERYVLVVKGDEGAFVCDTDGERFLWEG